MTPPSRDGDRARGAHRQRAVPAQPDRRQIRATPAQRRSVICGGSGGANSHVSGIPLLPSAPSGVPLSVNVVTPDEPVRTSIDSLPVNVSVLPFPNTLPAAPISGSILP